MTAPKISIIVSTYNSSHLLKYAIRSVLNSDYANWELIIVGDGCTDDTPEVIRQFNDERIRFTNLEQNSGQQATPSNVGLSQVRGEYVCYLNQDDMYLPWHLGSMLKTIAATGADIICAGHVMIDGLRASGGRVEIVASKGPVAKRNRYDPRNWYLASSWFMTTEAARDVGPWKLEAELYVAPSQEWMFRAWRMKKRIFCPSEVSVVFILSGTRAGSYRKRDDTLHSAVYERIICATNPRKELARALGNDTVTSQRLIKRAIRRSYMSTIGRASMLLGIHPEAVHRIARFGGRGGGVKKWQRTVQLGRGRE